MYRILALALAWPWPGPGPGPGLALAWPWPPGGRLIGGAGAVAPAAGRPEADLWPMFPNLEKQISEKVSTILECPLWG